MEIHTLTSTHDDAVHSIQFNGLSGYITMLKLNADLGEGLGPWKMGQDEALMPLIDEASIACGFHASDPVTMKRTLALAERHGVSVGAHPGYPDLVGFGRRSIALSAEELCAAVQYQVGALSALAETMQLSVEYVKPHGALYNDMMRDRSIMRCLMQAVAELPRQLALVIQATVDNDAYSHMAAEYGCRLKFEAFADRRYDNNGLLLPRHEPGAVLENDAMLAQAGLLINQGEVITVSGKRLTLQADTLCVHGDNPAALTAAAAIREILRAAAL